VKPSRSQPKNKIQIQVLKETHHQVRRLARMIQWENKVRCPLLKAVAIAVAEAIEKRRAGKGGGE
jgi:hypothetical protein